MCQLEINSLLSVAVVSRIYEFILNSLSSLNSQSSMSHDGVDCRSIFSLLIVIMTGEVSIELKLKCNFEMRSSFAGVRGGSRLATQGIF